MLSVLALFLALTNSLVAVGTQCGAHRAADLGFACPTPVIAHATAACAVTALQRRTIASYYARTSLHHRAQLRYAFPRDASGEPLLVIFLDKAVSGTPNSYEVLNPPETQSEGLVYERCGNLVHPGAPYGI